MNRKWRKRGIGLVASVLLLTVLPLGGIEAAPSSGSELVPSSSQTMLNSQSNQTPTYTNTSSSNQQGLQSNTIETPTPPVLAAQNVNPSQTLTDSVYGVSNLPVTANVYLPQEEFPKKIVREVVERRTQNSKHYLLADGSYQAIISLGDMHYEDENGKWQDINTQLIDEADINPTSMPLPKDTAAEIRQFAAQNKALKAANQLDNTGTPFHALGIPFSVTIPKKLNQGYSVGKGTDQLMLIPQEAASVVGSVYNDAINYNNVWPKTDVQLQVQNDGLKESIVLKDSSAPNKFSFEVKGNLADNLTSGQLHISPAWLIDQQGIRRDVQQSIRKDGNRTYIDEVADTTGLTFPVTIDPTITISNYTGCTINADSPTTTSCSSNGNVYVTQYENSYHAERGLLLFDLSSLKPNGIVNSATLYATNGTGYPLGYTFPPHAYMVYNILQPWSSSNVNWNNQPPYDTTLVASEAISMSITKPAWDITATFSKWVAGNLPNYGIIIKNSENDPYSYPEPYAVYLYNFYASVNYNDPPQTASILTPQSGVVWDGVNTISWNAATDSDTPQSQLKYEVQLSTDGGATFNDLVSLTSAGATTYTYDFSSSTETTNAYIRIRSYDGLLYSNNWVQSAPFTIHHNHPPYTPSSLNPGSSSSSTPQLVAGVTPTLSWTFSDPDAGNTQSAYDVIIKDATGANTVYDSGWVTSSSSSFTVPAGKLNRGTVYSWQVGVKDNKGAASPYSALYFIKINTLPTLTLTSYTDGQQVADNVLTFTWTYSDADGQAQNSFQILGSQDNWSTVAYNSGVVAGNAATFTTSPLASGTWSFKVLVNDGLEWSNAALRNNLSLPNAFEPNDTFAQAVPVSYGQTYNSLVGTSTDVDFYTYTAAASGIDRLVFTVPSGLNYDVYIYDANQNLIATNVIGTGTVNVLYDVTVGSTYYVKIFGVNGSYSSTSTYSFVLSKVTMQFQSGYQYDSNGNITSKTTTKQ